MGINIENLKHGQWVAIIGCVDDADGVHDGHRRIYTGRPSMVVSVCPPFVCVSDGIVTESLDCRYWELTKVSQRYVKSVLSARREEPCPACGKRDIYFEYPPYDDVAVASCNSCEYEEPVVDFWKTIKPRRVRH